MTDIHIKAASKIFNVPEDKVTKEMREKAKLINFGMAFDYAAIKLFGNDSIAELKDITPVKYTGTKSIWSNNERKDNE